MTDGVHWGNWYLGHIGKIVGIKGMRKLFSGGKKTMHNFGTFTNLGIWQLPNIDPKDMNTDEAYICAAPGSSKYPISVGVITWNGNLSISFKIHPSVCSDREFPRAFIESFKKNILNDINSY